MPNPPGGGMVSLEAIGEVGPGKRGKEEAMEERQEILRRMKSIEGHVTGVSRMVEKDAYCIEVAHQLRAVQKAVQRVSGIILDQHLRHCVAGALEGVDLEKKEKLIGEIRNVFKENSRG